MKWLCVGCRGGGQDRGVGVHGAGAGRPPGVLDPPRRAPRRAQLRPRHLHLRHARGRDQPARLRGLGAEHRRGEDGGPRPLRVPGQHRAQDQPRLLAQHPPWVRTRVPQFWHWPIDELTRLSTLPIPWNWNKLGQRSSLTVGFEDS